MKYKKCPRCGLNYINAEDNLCKVCRDELDGKKSIFDTEDAELIVCPYCEKNFMGIEDLMCQQCLKKRNKGLQDK